MTAPGRTQAVVVIADAARALTRLVAAEVAAVVASAAALRKDPLATGADAEEVVPLLLEVAPVNIRRIAAIKMEYNGTLTIVYTLAYYYIISSHLSTRIVPF